jgi:putative membrane protein
MFINFLAIMLINLTAGLFLLAYYVFRGLDDPNQRQWAPGFAIVGIIGLATGLDMIFTWPLPSSFNISFGEMTVLFGALYLGAALALGLGWNLMSVAVYAFFAGIAAIIVGIRLINLHLTQEPALAGAGFIIAGLTGVLLGPVLYLKENQAARTIFVIIAIIAFLIFAFIGYEAYWGHIADYLKWVPATLKK